VGGTEGSNGGGKESIFPSAKVGLNKNLKSASARVCDHQSHVLRMRRFGARHYPDMVFLLLGKVSWLRCDCSLEFNLHYKQCTNFNFFFLI
jgi:hypothetical protein